MYVFIAALCIQTLILLLRGGSVATHGDNNKQTTVSSLAFLATFRAGSS